MNDRSQAGTALKNGNMEFMQNRRIPADDGRGMGEYLNERDSLGNGIRVPATYYVQVFNSTTEKSLQRQVQMKVDMPLQMVYSFGKTNMQTRPVQTRSNTHLLPFLSQRLLYQSIQFSQLHRLPPRILRHHRSQFFVCCLSTRHVQQSNPVHSVVCLSQLPHWQCDHHHGWYSVHRQYYHDL